MAGNGRVYPESVEAEQFVLGCVLNDESCLKTIMDAGMQSESFYKNAHAVVFNAFLSLSKSKNPIDLLTTGDELERMQKLSYIGGPGYLTELCDAIGSVRSLPHYIKIIKEKHSLRQIIDLSIKTQEDCFAPTAELSLIWESFVASMVSINGDTKTGESRKDRNLTEDIRNWVLDTSGTFAGHECDISVQSVTKRDKTTRRKVFQRLVKEGLIERVGNRNGYFRRVENQVEEIDWRDSSTGALDFRWPFGLEELVKLHPGSLVVIAGEQNAGKTAFMLNLVKLNMNLGREIYYASSEFGGEELKERLSGFEDMSLDEWNFHFFNRTDEFQDIIKPDDINLIDYFEISTNFYEVGGKLKLIHDKLGQGIAVVALQKDSKASQGRGGSFGLEKPRLYLNLMDNYPAGQTIQIRKAKNWVDKTKNPNGMELGFSIYAGCILTSNADWHHPVRAR